MQHEAELLLRAVDLMMAERAALSARGPHFCIHHRFRLPGCVCAPGEEVAEVMLLHRSKQVAVPLSLVLRQMFDYLARHRHIAQSTSQIAAGMMNDPFCQRHGRNAKMKTRFNKTVSRPAVKQQILRLRNALAAAFRTAGMRLDPTRVVVSETTVTNEVRYRLRASVSWDHPES